MAVNIERGIRINGSSFRAQAPDQTRVDLTEIVEIGVNGHVPVVDPIQSMGRVREAYRRRWIDARRGLFSEGVSEKGTPLLRDFISRLSKKKGPLTVMEAAAGSGDHAMLLARQLPNTNVIAVDSAPEATKLIHKKALESRNRFGVGSSLVVVTEDVLACLEALKPDSLDGFHANSFLHFLSASERRAILDRLHQVLAPGGIAAFSYKAIGDAQHLVGKFVRKDEIGVYARDPAYEEITRLFVANPRPLIKELYTTGFDLVCNPMCWDMIGYDFEGKKANFIAFEVDKAA